MKISTFILAILVFTSCFKPNDEEGKKSGKTNEGSEENISDYSIAEQEIESGSYYFISGEVDNEEYFLPDVKVMIYSDDELDTIVFTNDTGYYEVNYLPINREYEIHFSKKGSFSKFCLLKRYSEENSDSIGNFPLSINVTLIEEKYLDLSKLDSLKSIPAVIGYYNKEIDNIEWDLEKLEEYKLKLDEARKTRIKI